MRITAAFADAAGAALDPDEITFTVRTPAGASTSYTYPGDWQIRRNAVGDYHVDVSATLPGLWYYRWESTGEGQGAQERQFIVEASVF